MPHPGPEPGSPADWLRHASSDLAIAQVPMTSGVLLETRCFHLQQAAEKSLKAVLVSLGIPAPRTHNLKTLMEMLPRTCPLPTDVALAASLTDYAVISRYPGDYEEITEEEYREAVRLAEAVVSWGRTVTESWEAHGQTE